MSKTLPDFVSDDATSTPAEPLEPVVDAAPAAEAAPDAAPAAEGRPRGPDGKFAPVAPVVEAAPAAEPAAQPVAEVPASAPAPAPTPDQGFAPIAALLDEREKRQAAEKRANELAEWRAQQEAQARRQPVPDPQADPAGFQAFQAQQLDAIFWDQRLEMSRNFAELRHTPEKVGAAFEWGVQRCDRDPFFNAQVRSSKDPVGFVVQQWEQQQLLSEMTPDEITAFRTWKSAQMAPSAQAAAPASQLAAIAPATAPPPAPVAPRPSLAAAPAAAMSGAPIPRDGAETYRALFG